MSEGPLMGYTPEGARWAFALLLAAMESAPEGRLWIPLDKLRKFYDEAGPDSCAPGFDLHVEQDLREPLAVYAFFTRHGSGLGGAEDPGPLSGKSDSKLLRFLRIRP